MFQVREGKHIGKRPELQSESRRMTGFTKRQMDVIKLLSIGYKDKEMGKLLGITRETVRNHLFRIYEILNVDSRLEAYIELKKLGLIHSNDNANQFTVMCCPKCNHKLMLSLNTVGV